LVGSLFKLNFSDKYLFNFPNSFSFILTLFSFLFGKYFIPKLLLYKNNKLFDILFKVSLLLFIKSFAELFVELFSFNNSFILETKLLDEIDLILKTN